MLVPEAPRENPLQRAFAFEPALIGTEKKLPRRPMMWPVTSYLSGAVWADAVFVSGLQRCDEPSAGQVRQAVIQLIVLPDDERNRIFLTTRYLQ